MPWRRTSATASVESRPPETRPMALTVRAMSAPALAHVAPEGATLADGAEVLVPRRLAPHGHVELDARVRGDDAQHRADLQRLDGAGRLHDGERAQLSRRVDGAAGRGEERGRGHRASLYPLLPQGATAGGEIGPGARGAWEGAAARPAPKRSLGEVLASAA